MQYSELIPDEDRGSIISRYLHMRALGRDVNALLVHCLEKDLILEGARKLGFLHEGSLVFRSEDESSILMDYCLHNVRRDGLNTIEQYLIDSPPDPDSDEMVHLQAAKHATFNVLIIEMAEPGFGAVVTDLVTNETFFIVDIALGNTSEPGIVLATRLLQIEGFRITGGAGVPTTSLTGPERDPFATWLRDDMDADKDDFDPADLIRGRLQAEGYEPAQYSGPRKPSARSRKILRQQKKRLRRRR